METASAGGASAETRGPRAVTRDLDALGCAVYAAVAATKTPALDRGLGGLTRAADRSKLWLAAAAGMAALGGRRGRRGAATGLLSIGVASATVNLPLKGLSRRPRPDRDAAVVPLERQVRMPASTSFPSGHAASAFAFATAVGHAVALLAGPLRLLAYSRVHTGVHYPTDVIAGSLLGGAAGSTVAAMASRRWRPGE